MRRKEVRMENKNSPAFPVNAADDFTFLGLSKREYFAGLAMQAMLSNPVNNSHEIYGVNGSNEKGYIPFETLKIAIQYADALLKQLEEKKGGGDGK